MSEHTAAELLEEIRPEGPKWREWLRTLVVIAVAALLLWWCFAQVDFSGMVAELRRANVGLFVAALIAGHVGLYFTQLFAVYVSLRSVGYPGPLGKFLLATSALQLPGAVQIHLSSAGLVAYNKRRHGLPIGSTAAAAMFVYFSDATVFAVGLAFAGRAMGEKYAMPLLGFAVFLVFLQLVAMGYLRGRFDRFLPAIAAKPREWGFIRPLTQITGRTYAQLVGMRLFVFAAMALPSALGLRAFGVEAPVGYLAAAIPLGTFLGNVPVAFGGFGTTQAVMLELLGTYGTDEAILAWSLCWTVGLILCRALQGAIFFRSGIDELLATPAGPQSGESVPNPDEPGR